MSITSDGQNTDEVRLVSFLQLATRTPPLLASPPSAFSSFLAPPCNDTDEGGCPLESRCTLYLLILQLDVVLLHVAVDLCALVTQLLLQAFYQLPWTQIYNIIELYYRLYK